MFYLRRTFEIVAMVILVTATFLVANAVMLHMGKNTFQPDYKLPGKMLNMAGRNVHYIEKGSGPTVILLHDIGFSIEYYEPLIDILSQRYKVIAIDLLGHGYTDKPRDVLYDPVGYAGFVARVLDTINAQPAFFVVHGNSSNIVAELTKRYPARVRGGLLVNGYPGKVDFFVDDILTRPLLGEAAVSVINRWMIKYFLHEWGFYNPLLVKEKHIDVITRNWAIPGAKLAYLKSARQFNDYRSDELNPLRSFTVLVSKQYYDRLGLSKKLKNISISEKIGYLPFLESPELIANKVRYLYK